MIIVCILVQVHVRQPRLQASIEFHSARQCIVRRVKHCESRYAIYLHCITTSISSSTTPPTIQLEALFGKMVRLRNI